MELFSSTLLPPTSLLPEGYNFSPLQRDGYVNGHLDVLKDLAYIGEITQTQWEERFDYMRACPDTYYVLVILKDNVIVGTGTLVGERKL